MAALDCFTRLPGSLSHHQDALPDRYLSKTFQSNLLFSPGDTTRRTVSTENYIRQVSKDYHKNSQTPWGRKDSYGARNFIHVKGTPTANDMVIVAKGSKHFGSGLNGVPPRGILANQQYQVTPSMKSRLRPNDELIPAPGKVDLHREIIDKRFPIHHPFKSHIAKSELLPSMLPRQVPVTENAAEQFNYIHPADSPASAPEANIMFKTRGGPYRHEQISIPFDTQRKPMTWPQAQRYKMPGNQLEPLENLPSTEVSEETLKILGEANKSLLVSIYQKDFNDHGDLRLKTMTDQEVVETFENLELREKPKMPENLTMALISDSHDQTSDDQISDDQTNNNNNNNNSNLRFKRPMYKGVRPYTTMGNFNNINNIRNQQIPSSFQYRTKSASPPRQQQAGQNENQEYSTRPFLSKTEYQYNYNGRHPGLEAPGLKVPGLEAPGLETSDSRNENQVIVPENPFWSKTEYQHIYNERHPGTEIPDLRDSRDARKPLLERRHHVLMGERKIYLQR